jgi:hypothetical protein
MATRNTIVKVSPDLKDKREKHGVPSEISSKDVETILKDLGRRAAALHESNDSTGTQEIVEIMRDLRASVGLEPKIPKPKILKRQYKDFLQYEPNSESDLARMMPADFDNVSYDDTTLKEIDIIANRLGLDEDLYELESEKKYKGEIKTIGYYLQTENGGYILVASTNASGSIALIEDREAIIARYEG